jgi:hypothetical protein
MDKVLFPSSLMAAANKVTSHLFLLNSKVLFVYSFMVDGTLQNLGLFLRVLNSVSNIKIYTENTQLFLTVGNIYPEKGPV